MNETKTEQLFADKLNAFLKDTDTSVDQLFNKLLKHEKIAYDKKLQGMKTIINNLTVQKEYDTLMKELQTLDFDKSMIQREALADFLIDFKLKFYQEEAIDEVIAQKVDGLIDEYLKALGIPREKFNEVFNQQLKLRSNAQPDNTESN